jgi:hypothetical protein
MWFSNPVRAIDPAPVTSTVQYFTFSDHDSVFQIGEDLIYNVSYAFIDIGQVRIKVLDKITEQNKSYYKAIVYIDSYKGVPFVDLHAIYESSIKPSIYSMWFRSRTKMDSQWKYVLYTYDYQNHNLCFEHGIWGKQKIEKRDTVQVDTVYQDGLSLFYFARANLMSQCKVNIPTVVSEEKVNTFISFSTERSGEKIDSVQYPIDVVHFRGKADFVGIFGLTGDFEGWFSNDAARVPILAKMKVLIGNVRIELRQWKREGWMPPRYVENMNK